MATSGNLLADRRYAYAEAAFAEGDLAATIDLARQVLDLAPDFAAASFLLGQALEGEYERQGRSTDARATYHDATRAFEAARAADPADVLGAGLRLARLGIGEPLGAMTPGYVRALFDEYAIRFDRHLVRSLRYRGPDLLGDALRRACSRLGRPFRFGLALDLGCGTGLAGEVMRGRCHRLAGIDLSLAMVERARRKSLYDELATGDLVDWLATRPEAEADLALAADVFVYLGDLQPAFAAARHALAPAGLLAFTVQAAEGDGVTLGDDLRYAHGERHLRTLAAASGFEVALLEAASTREDRGVPVRGFLVVLTTGRRAGGWRRASATPHCSDSGIFDA